MTSFQSEQADKKKGHNLVRVGWGRENSHLQRHNNSKISIFKAYFKNIQAFFLGGGGANCLHMRDIRKSKHICMTFLWGTAGGGGHWEFVEDTSPLPVATPPQIEGSPITLFVRRYVATEDYIL